MKTIIRALRKLTASPYFPFLVLFVLMLGLHMFLPMHLLDDRYYTRMTEKTSLLPYLAKTYNDWSSRLIILAAVRSMLGFFPQIVWRVLNPAIFALLGYLISRLITSRPSSRLNWFIAFQLLIYPFLDMRSAGWVTTSVNYLWVLSFGFYSILIAKKALNREKISPLEYIAAIPALLFGANQEQMCIVLVLVFLISLVRMIRQKQFSWFIPAGALLSIGSLGFLLTALGNHVRRLVEIKDFINFGQLSLIEKLELGISSTLERFMLRPNLSLLLLCGLLVVVIFVQYRSTFHRVYALVPFIGVLFFGSLNRLDGGYFPYLQNMQYRITENGFVTLENFTRISSYLPFLVTTLLMGMIVILLYAAFSDQRRGLLAGGILLLGFMTRVMMGFSPTVWTSSSRTLLFMYAAIIFCGAMLFDEISKSDKPVITRAVLITAGFTAAFSFLNLMAGIFEA